MAFLFFTGETRTVFSSVWSCVAKVAFSTHLSFVFQKGRISISPFSSCMLSKSLGSAQGWSHNSLHHFSSSYCGGQILGQVSASAWVRIPRRTGVPTPSDPFLSWESLAFQQSHGRKRAGFVITYDQPGFKKNHIHTSGARTLLCKKLIPGDG